MKREPRIQNSSDSNFRSIGIKTANELNAAEKFEFGAIVEFSQDAIYSRDLSGAVVSWNRTAERMYGYKASEIIGRHISILFPPGELSNEEFIIERIKRGESIETYETIRIKKGGLPIPVSLTVFPIKDKKGDVIGVSKIARDLTESLLTKKILLANNEVINNQLSEIEVLYQTAPVGLGYVDRDLRYKRVNEKLARINGMPAEAHIGRQLREVLPEALANKVEVFYRHVLETGNPVQDLEISGRTISSSKEDHTWLINYYPVKNRHGEIIGVNTVVHEITKRRQVEEQVRKSEQRLRGLIDNLFSFVGLLDADGTVTEVNRTALNVANLSPQDVIGKKFPDTYWWAWSEDVQEQLRNAIKRASQGETLRYDVVVRIAENEFLTIDFQLAPMMDETGTVVNLVPSAIDISERLLLEAKLKQTAQISLAAELAAGLAHEIKNPLSGIQGAIDLLLRRSTLDNAGSRILKNIRGEVERIDESVRLLLNRMRIRPACFVHSSLTETVRRAIRLAHHQIIARQIKHRIKIESHLPRQPLLYLHDPAQIEDAILNLIINAVDAIGEEKGRIIVRLFKRQSPDSSEDEIVIEVSDTGCGMSSSELKNIFTPFFTTKSAGTGLGLAAVKRIAETHGGNCCVVKSAIDEGTTFAICLPLKTF